MRPRLAWVGAGLAAAAVITILISRPVDPYPLQVSTGASQSNPTAVGTPARAVVLFLEPRPGDRFELLGAEPVGLAAGERPVLYLSRPVVDPDGNRTIGAALEPLAGAVFEAPAGASPGPEHTVGIVAEITPDRPGIFELTAIRVHFRVNGGGEQIREGISVRWTVCADDSVPTACD